MERELDGFLSGWEKLARAYSDNPDASQDIQQLLDESDQEMYRVKTQYREGRLTYAQVQQAIQTLHRKVRLYQAVLDDTHMVDLQGRVITSRESKRAPGEW
jgi:sRNA-binding protein